MILLNVQPHKNLYAFSLTNWNIKIPVVVKNNVQLYRDIDQLTGTSCTRTTSFNTEEKEEICIWQVKIRKQGCNVCQKQQSTFAVKECDTAVPAGHMLHVPQNVNVHKAMFPVPGLYVPNVLTELLSHILCLFCSQQ